MHHTLKTLVRKPLNALGLDLVHLQPATARDHDWEPTPANRYRWLLSLGINMVIDIGAHTGEFAATIHDILPHASIVSFEPQEGPFAELERRMGRVPNFTAFRCALGDSTGPAAMHRNEYTPSSSLLPMADRHRQAFPFTASETVKTIDVRRLDDVAQDLQLVDNILVKIDVQGYERHVIEGGANLIRRTKLLIVETSFQTLYEGQPLFDEIYDLLRAKGLKYIGNWDQLQSPADGSILQADAIFVRP